MALRLRLCLAALLLSACGAVENVSRTLEFDVSGDVLRLNGIINSRALRQFETVMTDHPQVSVIVLDQIEGSLDGDVVAEMGYRIRERGLATRMEAGSAVFSGGVDLFLGGVDRVIAPGAQVGVHEWASSLGSARDYPPDDHRHEPTRGYIEDMLGSDAFYWFTIDAAAFDEVHLMSRAEMLTYGLITR